MISGPISGGSPGGVLTQGGSINKLGAADLRLTGDVFSRGALGGINAFTISAGTVTIPNHTTLEGTYTATAGTSTFSAGAHLRSLVFGNSSPTLNGGAITTTGDFNVTHTAGIVRVGAVLAGASKIAYSGAGYLQLLGTSTLTGDAAGVVADISNVNGNLVVSAPQSNWTADKVVKNAGDLFLGTDNAFGSALLQISAGGVYSNNAARVLSSPVSLLGNYTQGSWDGDSIGFGGWLQGITLSGPVYLNGGARNVTLAENVVISGPISGGSPGGALTQGGSINKYGAAVLTLSNVSNSFGGLYLGAGTVNANGNFAQPEGTQLGLGWVDILNTSVLNVTGAVTAPGTIYVRNGGDLLLAAGARLNVGGDVHVDGDQSRLWGGDVTITGALRLNGYENNVGTVGGTDVTSNINASNVYKFQWALGGSYSSNQWGEATISGRVVSPSVTVVGDSTMWNDQRTYGQGPLGLGVVSAGSSATANQIGMVRLENGGSIVVNNTYQLGTSPTNQTVILVSESDKYGRDRSGNVIATAFNRGGIAFIDRTNGYQASANLATSSFHGTFRLQGASTTLYLYDGSLNAYARIEGNGELNQVPNYSWNDGNVVYRVLGRYRFFDTDGGFTGKLTVNGGEMMFVNPKAPASGTNGFNPSLITMGAAGNFSVQTDSGLSTSLAASGFAGLAPLTWNSSQLSGTGTFNKYGLGELVLGTSSPNFAGNVRVRGGVLSLQMAAGQTTGLLGSALSTAKVLTLTTDKDSRALGGTFRLLDVTGAPATQVFTDLSVTTADPGIGAAHRIVLGSGANLSFSATTFATMAPADHVVLSLYGISASSRFILSSASVAAGLTNLAPTIVKGDDVTVGALDFAAYNKDAAVGQPLSNVVTPGYVDFVPAAGHASATDYLSYAGGSITGVSAATTAKGIKFSSAGTITGSATWVVDGLLYAADPSGNSSGDITIGVGSLTTSLTPTQLVVQQWNAGKMTISSLITNRNASLSTSLLKAGSGVLALTNTASDYKGGTYVLQGRLDINGSSSLDGSRSPVGAATGAIYVNGRGGDPSQSGASIGTSAGADVWIANPLNSYDVLNYVGDPGNYLTIKGAYTGDAPATRGGFSEINIASGSLRLSGAVRPGTVGAWLKKSGPGVLEIGGDSTYAGTEVVSGKLQVMSALAAGSATGAYGLVLRGGTVQFGVDGLASLPVSLTGATTIVGVRTVTVADSGSVYSGMTITGTGIPSGTTVSSVSGNTLTLSAAATASGSNLTFTAGNSAVRLTVGKVTLGGGTLMMDITGNPADTTGFDSFYSSGGVVIDAATTFRLRKSTVGTAVTPGRYLLGQYAGSLTGDTNLLSLDVDAAWGLTTPARFYFSQDKKIYALLDAGLRQLTFKGSAGYNTWKTEDTTSVFVEGPAASPNPTKFFTSDYVTFNDQVSGTPKTVTISGAVAPTSITVTGGEFTLTGGVSDRIARTGSDGTLLDDAPALYMSGGKLTLDIAKNNVAPDNVSFNEFSQVVLQGGTLVLKGYYSLGPVFDTATVQRYLSSIKFYGGVLQHFGSGTGYNGLTDYSTLFSAAQGQTVKIDTNGNNVRYEGHFGQNDMKFWKMGAGTLSLSAGKYFAGSGSWNSFAGETRLLGGTLELLTTRALGLSGEIIFLGGTLKHSAANGALDYEGNAVDYSGRFGATPNQAVSIDTAGQNIAWASGIKGAGTTTFAKTGAGMLAMNGASTHSGANTLYQGGLTIGHSTALGSGALNLVGGTFDASSLALTNAISYQSSSVGLANMANYGGTLTIATGQTLTASQAIGGTVNVLLGSNLVMQSGAAINVLAGQGGVDYRNSGATLQSASAYAGTLSVLDNATFDVRFAFGGGITANLGNLTLTSGNVDGAITSNRTVQKLTASSFALAGNNTFSGTLDLQAGRLLLRSAGAIGGAGAVAFNGGTLVYDNALSSSIDPSARATGAAKVEVSAAAGTAVWAGVTAASSLEKSGAGTLIIRAADSFTSVRIHEGSLALGKNGATSGRLFALSGSAKPLEFLGGTLEFREAVNPAISDYSAYVESTGTQVFRIGSYGSAVTFASTFGDATDSLVVTGDAAGSFVLGAANSWSGIAVNSGTLGLGAGGAFGSTSTILTVTNSGVVDFQNRSAANPMTLNANGKRLTRATAYTGLITVGAGFEPWADERIGGTFQVGLGAKLRMKSGGDVFAIRGTGEINYEAGLTGDTSLFTGVLRTMPSATYDLLSDFGGSLDANTYANSSLRLSAGTLAGSLVAAQMVEKHTAGLATLNGDAYFNGGLTVSGGTLAVSLGLNDELRTGVAGITIGSASRMELQTLNYDMTLNPPVAIQAGGSLVKQGSKVLNLAGVNALNGDFELQQGVVSLKSAAAIDGAGKIVFTGGTLQYSSLNSVDVSGRIDLARSTQVRIDTGNAPLVTFAGLGSQVATGSASLIKSGSTILSIAGPSYYSGGTTLSAGDLAVSHGQALGAGPLTLSAGRLRFQGASAVNLQVGGNLTINSGSMLMMRIADLSSATPAADSLTTTGEVVFTGAGTRTLWLSSLVGGTALRDIGNGFYKLFEVGASAPAVDLTKLAVNWEGGGPRQQRKEFLFVQNSLNPLEYGVKVQDVTLADLIWVGNPTNLSAVSASWRESLIGSFRGEDQQFFDLDRVTFDSTSSTKDVVITGTKPVGYRAGLAGVNPAEILVTGATSYRFSGDKGVTADLLSIDTGSQLDLSTTGGGKFKNINLAGNLLLNAGSDLEAPLANGIVFSGGRLVYASSTQDLSAYFSSNSGADIKVQVDAGASVVTFANGLGGFGASLIKYGAGELRLSAPSSYDGGTTVAAGRLTVGAAAALGSGDVDLTGGDLDVDGRNPFTTNGLATINLRSAASSLTNFSALTNRISVASGVSYDWTSGHMGELQVLGAGKVNLNLTGNIVRLTGNKDTDYYAGGVSNASAYTGYMNIKTTKTLALSSAFGGELDVNGGAWLNHDGGAVHTLRGVGTINYSSGSYADAADFDGLLKVLDGKQFVLNQDFGGSIDTTLSDVTNPAHVGLLLNGGILRRNLTARAVTVNGSVELRGTGNVTGKMTLNPGAYLKLADAIALIPQAGLQIDFKGGVLGMSALYSRDISSYIIETTDRIRINTDAYGQPANVTFASQLKASGLDKSGDGVLTLMSGDSEFRDGEIILYGGTLKAGTDDAFGRNRTTGQGGTTKLSRVHVNSVMGVDSSTGLPRPVILDLNEKLAYNDILWTKGDVKNAGSYRGTISLDDFQVSGAAFVLNEPDVFAGSIQTQAGKLVLSSGKFVGDINKPGQIEAFTGVAYLAPIHVVTVNGGTTRQIELAGDNNFANGLYMDSGRLVLASDTALGTTGDIWFSGGIIRFKAGYAHQDISGRIVAYGANDAQFEVDGGLTVTFATGLSSGGLTKLGAGTLELTGSNQYRTSLPTPVYGDATAVKGGTLRLTDFGELAGVVSVSAGARLSFNLDNTAPDVTNDISGAGVVDHANANDLTLSGDNRFTGNLTVTGGGRIIAGSTTAFGSSAAGYVAPGTNAVVDFAGLAVGRDVDFRDDSATVVGAQFYAGTLFVRDGAQFSLTPNESFGGTVDLENGSLYIFDADQNNRPSFPPTLLASLKGAGAVDYDGGRIDNAADYTGTLTMRAGTRYNVAQDFGGSFSLDGANATLVLESGSIGGSVSATGFANAVSKTTSDVFVLRGSNDLSAGLVVDDGTLVLRGQNLLTGGVVINGGVLELGHAAALGASGDIVFSSSTVGGDGWIRYTADNQQDISSRLVIQGNSSINIDTNGQTVRFATAIDAGPHWADLIKKGAGDLILSPNANSNYGYSFVKIEAGRLVLDSAGALGDPSDPANLFEVWFDGGRLRHTINNTQSYAGRIIAIDGKDVSIDVDAGASVVYAAGISGDLSTLRKFGSGSLAIAGDSQLVGQDADLAASRLGVTVSSWAEEGTLVAGSAGAFGLNAVAVGAVGSTAVARVDLGGHDMANEIFVMNSAAQIKGAENFVGQVFIPQAVNFTATSKIGSDDGLGTVSTTLLEGAGATLTIGKDIVVPGGQGRAFNVVGAGRIAFASGVNGKIATDLPGDGALLPSTYFQGSPGDHFSGVIEILNGANVSLNTDLNNQVQLNVGGKLGLAVDDVWYVGSPSPGGAELDVVGGGTIEKNSAGVTNLHGALGAGFTGTYVVSNGVLRTASDNALGGGRVVVKGSGQLDMSGFAHAGADVVIVDAPNALLNAGQWGLDPVTLQRSAKYIEFLSTQDDPSARTTAHTSLELPTLADGGFFGKVRVTNGVKVDLNNGFYAPVDYYNGTLDQLASYQQTLSVFGNLVVSGSFNAHNASYADLRGDLDPNKVVMHSGSVVDFADLSSGKSILILGGRLQNAANYTGDLVIADGAALAGVAGNFGSGRIVLFNGSQLDVYADFANKILYHGGVLSNESAYRGELTIDPNTDAGWNGFMNVTGGSIGGKIIAPETTSLKMNGAASAVEMHGRTVLSGTGTIANLTMRTGAVLKPGNSPGILNIGNTTLIGGARAVLEFYDVNGPRGVGGFDSFNVSGTMDLRQLSPANRFILNLRSLSSVTPDTAGTSLNLGSLGPSDYRDFKIFDYQAGTLLRPIAYNIAELFDVVTAATDIPGGITGFFDTDGTSIVGINRFAIYDNGQGIFLRYGASPLENFATPLTSPLVVNLPAIHVGDPFASFGLTITNNQTAPGTTQGLNVAVTAPVQAPATTNGGSVTSLAAGLTNVGGISVGLQQPTVGGTYTGTVKLTYTSASLDPLSGVPPTVIGSQDVVINGIAYEVAVPVFANTMNFGSVRRGSAIGNRDFSARNLTITNGAQSVVYGEVLNADFENPASGVVATGSVLGLAPTSSDSTTLSVNILTAGVATGLVNRTVDLKAVSKAVVGSGLTDTVTTTQLQLNGTIYDAAVGNVALADRSINLGVIRVGGAFIARNIAITNDVSTSTWAETLGAAFDPANTSANIAAAGSFSGLGAGAGANSSLSVTIANTAAAGVVVGTARVGFTTEEVNGSGLATEGVGHQDITVTGTVHALAVLDSIATIQNGRTHVGKQFTDTSVRIANDATLSGGYSDHLQVGVRSFDPRLAVAGGVVGLAPNAVDTSSMTVRITDYQVVGDKSFDFTLASRSLEPTAGLGDIDLADRVVNVQGLVYSGKSVWSGASGAYTNTNWSSWTHLGGIPGIDGTFSVGDTATFNGASAQAIALTGVNPELASITFANSVGTTLSSAAAEKLILGTGVSLAEIQTQLGTNAISSGIDLVQSLRVTTAAGSSLTLNGALVNTGTATGVEFTGSGVANLGSAFTGPKLNFALSGGILNVSIDQTFGTGTFSAGTLDAPVATTATPVVVSLDTFAKTGAGDLILGHASDTGALRIDLAAGQTATVTGGSLKNNATLNRALDVSAATLSGVGSSGSLRMLAGSTFAPGNSIGRYTVNGALTLNTGSTLKIEVSPTSSSALSSDLITVTGAAHLGGSLVVSQIGSTFPLTSSMRSIIIDHASFDGSFSSVAFDSATALLYLTLRPKVESFADHTELYFAVALPDADPRTVSSLPSIMGRTGSMFVKSVTGDPYSRLAARGPSSAQGITQSSLLNSKDSLDQAVSGAQDNTWVEGYAQTIQARQGAGTWGYDYQLGGVAAGIDLIRENDWVMGLAFGLSESQSKHELNGDKTNSTAYDMGLYTATKGDDATVSFVAFYSNYSMTHTRFVDMGAASLPATGKPAGFRAGVELAYDSKIFSTPDSATYLRMGLGAGIMHRDAFKETGDDSIAMNFDALNMPYFQLGMGMGYATDLFEDDKTWQLFGEGMFTRQVTGSNASVQARYNNRPGADITVASPEYTYIQFQPSIGVSWREGLGSAEFKVFAEIRGGKTAPGASASYKLRF